MKKRGFQLFILCMLLMAALGMALMVYGAVRNAQKPAIELKPEGMATIETQGAVCNAASAGSAEGPAKSFCPEEKHVQRA